ncbi:Protein F09E5.11 [Aphelenchoides avenae]|nr:Protein F09E5.11 [Aphelenchus avenae]
MWQVTEKERAVFYEVTKDIDLAECKLQSGLSVKSAIKKDRLGYDDVEAIYKALPSKEIEFHKFVNALRPAPPPPKENREYSEMVKSVDPTRRYGQPNLMENFGQEMRSVNRQMIAVVNTLITVGGAFAFGFFGIDLAYPHMKLDIATRMLIGLTLGTVVFFADIYFIIKNMEEIQPSASSASVKEPKGTGSQAVSSDEPRTSATKKSRKSEPK